MILDTATNTVRLHWQIWVNEGSQGGRLAEHLWREVRHAARGLLRRPGFSAVVLATLALGIGATTAIFSVVYGVLILPPPYPGSERMVYAPRQQHGSGSYRWYWSHLNYRDARTRATSFELFEGVRLSSAVLNGRDRAERVFVRYVTPRFLDMYAAHPQLGRAFGDQDDRVPGGHPVALITHKL